MSTWQSKRFLRFLIVPSLLTLFVAAACAEGVQGPLGPKGAPGDSVSRVTREPQGFPGSQAIPGLRVHKVPKARQVHKAQPETQLSLLQPQLSLKIQSLYLAQMEGLGVEQAVEGIR